MASTGPKGASPGWRTVPRLDAICRFELRFLRSSMGTRVAVVQPRPDRLAVPGRQGRARGAKRRRQRSLQTSQLAPQCQQPEPFVLTIGDIGITRELVVTANGVAPLAGSQWTVRDLSVTRDRTPRWAMALGIILLLACLLGLLLFLIRKSVTTGYVEVQVTSGSLTHVTQVPVYSFADVVKVRRTVREVQAMAASRAV